MTSVTEIHRGHYRFDSTPKLGMVSEHENISLTEVYSTEYRIRERFSA